MTCPIRTLRWREETRFAEEEREDEEQENMEEVEQGEEVYVQGIFLFLSF